MNPQRLMVQLMGRLPRPLLRRMAGAPVEVRGCVLDPMVQVLAKEAQKQPPLQTLTPQEARAALDEAATLLQTSLPKFVMVSEASLPGPGGEIPYTLYRPAGVAQPAPILLFFHFGGFVIGSRRTCHGFCGLLADRAQVVVLNVEYRLAPEHPFPAPVEDALAAYRWTLENAETLGGAREAIAVAGDSAGGMLAAVIAQEAKREAWTPPKCQVLIYPWLIPHSGLPSYDDFGDAYPLTADIMEWFAGHYFTQAEDKEHRWAAPLNERDLSGLPETFIYTAGFDPLRDEAEAYAEKLRKASVRVHYKCFENLPHSFTMFGIVPAAANAMAEIADDIQSTLKA